jgi:hypothetical protein
LSIQYVNFFLVEGNACSEGLLSNPISIGTKKGWEQRLKDCGATIKNHQAKLIKN